MVHLVLKILQYFGGKNDAVFFQRLQCIHWDSLLLLQVADLYKHWGKIRFLRKYCGNSSFELTIAENLGGSLNFRWMTKGTND